MRAALLIAPDRPLELVDDIELVVVEDVAAPRPPRGPPPC